MHARTRSQDECAPIQLEARQCPYCLAMFVPKRLRQEFCNDKHRIAYHKDIGAEGVVAGVTRLKRGVSVVVHFPDGPAGERAIGLRKGQAVRTVPAPHCGHNLARRPKKILPTP